MQLKDYLPPFWQNIREFDAIMDAEQPEMDFIYQGVTNFINDQFIDTLTAEGCTRWENALGIVYESPMTVEQRRDAIKNKVNDLPVYTFKAVDGLMESLFGADGYTLYEDTANYTLILRNLSDDKDKQAVALAMLEKMVPCNIIIAVGYLTPIPLKFGSGISATPHITILNGNV